MNIIIYRRRFTPWSVDGTMIINGGTFCRTIEHPKNYLLANSYKIVLVPVKIENGTEEFKNLPVIFGADDRVPPKVVQKPFITPGLGPFRLKIWKHHHRQASDYRFNGLFGGILSGVFRKSERGFEEQGESLSANTRLGQRRYSPRGSFVIRRISDIL